MTHRTRHPRKPRFAESVFPADVPLLFAMQRAAKLLPAERAGHLAPIQMAFDAFRRGLGSEAHWRALADAMNLGCELAERHKIASDHLPTFEAGKAALAAVIERQQAGSSWTLRGTEIADIDLAVFIHKVQLDYCSRGEFSATVTTVIARYRGVLAGQVPAGARVFTTGASSAATQESAHA